MRNKSCSPTRMILLLCLTTSISFADELAVKSVRTRPELEASTFCKKYACKESDGYVLRDKSIYTEYSTSLRPVGVVQRDKSMDSISFSGAQTDDGDPPRITSAERMFLMDLLETFGVRLPELNDCGDKAMKNSAIRVNQILKAKPFRCGSVKVYAGKVSGAIIWIKLK